MPQIPTRKAYKIRSPQTWDLIRAAYVKGETAASLAERFDVTEWAIRNRARKEGWTKRAYAIASEQNLSADRAAAAPLKGADACGAVQDETLIGAVLNEVADGEQVAVLALGAAARCIAAGRFAEAERLGKLAETLSRLAHGPHSSSARSSGARPGGEEDDAYDEPKYSPGSAPCMPLDQSKIARLEMDLMRAEVARRFSRLGAAYGRIEPDVHPDPQDSTCNDLTEGDAP